MHRFCLLIILPMFSISMHREIALSEYLRDNEHKHQELFDKCDDYITPFPSEACEEYLWFFKCVQKREFADPSHFPCDQIIKYYKKVINCRTEMQENGLFSWPTCQSDKIPSAQFSAMIERAVKKKYTLNPDQTKSVHDEIWNEIKGKF